MEFLNTLIHRNLLTSIHLLTLELHPILLILILCSSKRSKSTLITIVKGIFSPKLSLEKLHAQSRVDSVSRAFDLETNVPLRSTADYQLESFNYVHAQQQFFVKKPNLLFVSTLFLVMQQMNCISNMSLKECQCSNFLFFQELSLFKLLRRYH